MPEPPRAIDILDKPRCAGGTILARATDCLKGGRHAHFGIVGDDWLEVRVPASSAAAPFLTSRFVLAVEFANTYHEWRLLEDTWDIRANAGVVTARAVSLIHDLASAGKIRSVDATTGMPNLSFTVEATPEELIETYILDADLTAKGYGYFATGTIEPTERRAWQWNGLNRLELLQLICAQTAMEYRLRQNGSTNYLIDVVERVNGDLSPIEVRPGLNLRSFRRRRDGVRHFTVVEPFGVALPDGQRATIARNCWVVTAVDAANNRITLGDPAGAGAGPGPIIETDQYRFDGPRPGWLFRYHQGGLHRIVHSDPATQEVELDPGVVDTYAVGDLVEIRGGAGASGLAAEVTDGWGLNLWAAKRVTVVDGGNLRLTVDDPWGDVDMVTLDDRYRGWTVRPYFRAASTLMSANIASGVNPDHRQCTVTSTTGFQVGDLVYHTNADPAGAPNWTLASTAAYEVVSVDDATHVTIKHRRKAGAVGALINTRFLSAWRARTARRCTGCAAGANTIDVDSVTSIVAGDLIELVRQYDGPVLTELASPLGVSLYGVAAGVFERDSRGERNLLAGRNPVFRDWTGGPHALPDWWYGISRAVGVKNTDPQFLETGVASVRLTPRGVALLMGSISAGAVSATLAAGSGTGHRFEVGESVRLGAGTGNEEIVVLTSVSADGLTLGFAPCANNHSANEQVQSVMTPTVPSAVGATLTDEMTLAAHPLDCPSVGTLSTYAVRVPYIAKGFVAGDQVIVRLTITGHPELGGTQQQQTLTATVGTDIDADVLNVATLLVQQPVPGGRLNVEVAANLAGGNAYPHDKALYVCAVGLTQTTYDPGVIAEHAFATALHQAANASLALVSQEAPATYEFDVQDLYGADPAQWPHLQFLPGRLARTTQLAAGLSTEPLRITGLEVDYDRPAEVRAMVGTRQQGISELLANARIPVPVIRVTIDPTTGAVQTEVVTSGGPQNSQQEIQLPSAPSGGGGIIAIPPTFGNAIIPA